MSPNPTLHSRGVPLPQDATAARKALEHAGTMHWFHWAIVLGSLVLTVFAANYSKRQLDTRVEARFEREADQVVELVLERMAKYEDALWGGVAFMMSQGGHVDFNGWKDYAEALRIELKYPGINGIGVAHSVKPTDLPRYLAEQRTLRPEFYVRQVRRDKEPAEDPVEYLPIGFIIPVGPNQQAVGLDMSYESNRHNAALRARDTGDAQITGPITLVQDSGQTPGFLFYAPYYQGGVYQDVESRQRNFLGMVYAPFVVLELMAGTLEKERRHVGISIKDDGMVLYDEQVPEEEDFDPDPLYRKSVSVPLYGRDWEFDIFSAKSFREAAADSGPVAILLGGLVLDGTLLALFLLISRSSRRALDLADTMTHSLRDANQDMESVIYVMSHDLREPLRSITSFSTLLEKKCGSQLDEVGRGFVGRIHNAGIRMAGLLEDIMDLSKLNDLELPTERVELGEIVHGAVDSFHSQIQSTGAQVHLLGDLPAVQANATWVTQAVSNLLSNALKYLNKAGEAPCIEIEGYRGEEGVGLVVRDRGPGIDPKLASRIFQLFQRGVDDGIQGTGIGLAIVSRVASKHSGQAWAKPREGGGTEFFLTLEPQR